MRERESVYLVCTGQYSDWGPRAAFTTCAKAKAFMEKYARQLSDSPHILEMRLDFVEPTQDLWCATIETDGRARNCRNVSEAWRSDEHPYGLDHLIIGPRWEVRDVAPGRPKGCGVTDAAFTVYTYARSAQGAYKVARDTLKQVLALGRWKHGARGNL